MSTRLLHFIGWLILSSALPLVQAADAQVTAAGLIEAPGKALRVYRGDFATPLFGSISQGSNSLRFTPALPLVPGESYRIEVQAEDGSWSTQRLRFEKPQAVAPSVRLSPTPTVLPANALKLYLHFSQPMEQGIFLERLTLHRQDGTVVLGAFRETELWSPDGKRLTLWLHPGRQKTGVNLNRDEGPVLREGETHTIQIDATWRSTAGVALGKAVLFNLTATAPDHTSPDPQQWKLSVPTAGTQDALRLIFDAALDPAMLATALSVQQGSTSLVGQVHTTPDSLSWAFTPAAPWQTGSHSLRIDPLLEDLAGNNLLGPFEVDRHEPAPPARANVLRFEVR